MKHKFSLMWRVAVALVLVFSFSLVVAVPAAALTQPTVSIATGENVISTVDADYTIVFTLGHELLASGVSTLSSTDDTITITFPNDTAVADGTISNASIGATSGWFSDDYTTSGTGWHAAVLNNVTWSGSSANRTVTATLGTLDAIGASAQVWIHLPDDITNPSAVGDYTLTVKTSDETTAVTSASYSITAPPIPGTVSVYNPSDTLVYQYTGTDALDADKAGQYYGNANYTIEVGPGTYTPDAFLNITGEGLTLQGDTANPETVIIDGTGTSGGDCVVRISASSVTVEGFTVKNSPTNGIGINYATTGVTVQHNIISDGTTGCGIILIYDGATDPSKVLLVDGATVSDNVITTGYWTGIALMESVKNSTISDNTITGLGEGIVFKGGDTARHTENNIFTGNTITGCSSSGINLQGGIWGGTFVTDNRIEGNIISENTGIGIKINTGLTVAKLVITDNDITDNEGVGIEVGSWTAASDAIKFNNITGNDTTTNGYGLQNAVNETVVDATHNWWGSAVASEVAAMIYNSGTGTCDTTYDPFLTDTVDAIFSATAVTTGSVTSLDAETDVGVEVLVAANTPADAKVVSAAKYIDNPGAPLDNALAFYDVYVAGGSGTFATATDTVMLHFYAGDDDAVLYAWSSATATWVDVSPAAVFSEFGGFLYVTLTPSNATSPSTPLISDLTELPFAVCGEEVAEDILDYYRGADDVISTSELLTAANDWANEVVPPDFTEPISTTQLLALANEWAATE